MHEADDFKCLQTLGKGVGKSLAKYPADGMRTGPNLFPLFLSSAGLYSGKFVKFDSTSFVFLFCPQSASVIHGRASHLSRARKGVGEGETLFLVAAFIIIASIVTVAKRTVSLIESRLTVKRGNGATEIALPAKDFGTSRIRKDPLLRQSRNCPCYIVPGNSSMLG